MDAVSDVKLEDIYVLAQLGSGFVAFLAGYLTVVKS